MTDLGGRPSIHRVFALLNSANEVIYLGAATAGQSPWQTTWENRERIDNGLARLFRSIGERPTEITVIGSVGLPQGVARQILALLAGWFPRALVEKLPRGGRPQGRPVLKVENGRVQGSWPSRIAAARAAGCARMTMIRRLRRGGEWIDGVCNPELET